MNADTRGMARVSLPVVPLALALAACGGSDSRAQPSSEEAPRAPIVVFTPAKGKVLDAQPFVSGRLQAVIRVTGRAAPGQQLSVLGSCGGYSCDGITFADSSGRFRTRVQLVTPSKKRKAVTLTVRYADERSGEQPAAVGVKLRKATAPTQASPEKEAPPTTTSTGTGGQAAPSTGGSVAPYAGPRSMIVIGDSLAVGMAGSLRSLVPSDWDLAVDGRTGRPTQEGMQILAETPLPSGTEGSHAILAFSLGTNDSPDTVDAFEAAVRESMGYLGAHGCVLWATIARPPLNGISYKAMNQRLEALALEPELYGRLLVVEWKREYDRHKGWRREDGVHATPAGYAGRAQLYAQAAAGCPA